MALRTLRSNLLLLSQIVFDELPQTVVGWNLYVRIRRMVAGVPVRYDPVQRELPETRGDFRGRRFANRLTDLVIDGFPGSGNSFVSNNARAAVHQPVNIESHFHFTAQLKRAAALGVPAIVLVRDPEGACNSLKSKTPRYWNWLIVLRWLRYHRYVLRHGSKFAIVLFKAFTTDVDVIRQASPALAALTSGSLSADPTLQRASERPVEIDFVSWPTRLFIRKAHAVYARIEPLSEKSAPHHVSIT